MWEDNTFSLANPFTSMQKMFNNIISIAISVISSICVVIEGRSTLLPLKGSPLLILKMLPGLSELLSPIWTKRKMRLL
jgi:hypothetical protein